MVAAPTVSGDSQNRGLSLLSPSLAASIEGAAAISNDPDAAREFGLFVAMARRFSVRPTGDQDLRAGVRAFLAAPPGMQATSAPPRLVRRVLWMACNGGMTHRDLGRVLGGDGSSKSGHSDTGQRWHRHFVAGEPMRARDLRRLVHECVRLGWIDRERPQPGLSSTLAEWRRYFAAPWAPRLIAQINAAEAARRALGQGETPDEIELLVVRLSFENTSKARNNARQFSQAARWARKRVASEDPGPTRALLWCFQMKEWLPTPRGAIDTDGGLGANLSQ